VTAAAAGLVALSILTGCGGTVEAGAPRRSGSPTASQAGESRAPVEVPDSPVGDRARWVLGVLSGTEILTTAAIRDNVGARFLAGTPADQLEAELDRLRASGPWLPVDVDAVDGDAVVRLEDGSGRPWRLVISADSAGALDELAVRPVTGGPRAAATTWAEVHEQLTALDADVGMLAAEVTDDGRCVPITSIEADRPRPLASIFKLYVLGAVAQAVEDGEVTWSDRLVVTDEVRSLPSGTLQDEPDGTEVSVARAAAGMIAVSDNTATDLLMELVGRDAVESAMARMGHRTPDLNRPMLTTREYFTVGWGGADLRTRWADATRDGRRDVLESIPDGPIVVSGADVKGPAWSSGVDWFGRGPLRGSGGAARRPAGRSGHPDAPHDPRPRPRRGGGRGDLALCRLQGRESARRPDRRVAG
jgi:hypothetical protein